MGSVTGEDNPPKKARCADVAPEVLRRATVLGGGAFGTAMAQHLGKKGTAVRMWVLEDDVVAGINEKHENHHFLPGVVLSDNLTATKDVAAAVEGTELILLIIPTPFIARWVEQNQASLPWNVPIVCCSKGIEDGTLRTPYEILISELPGKYHSQLCVVSGPSFAKEVATGLPTNLLCAAADIEIAKKVQAALSCRSLRVYTAMDVVGAELCGAVKNVLAIACGASDGLGFGANARAGLIARGLTEMARLVVKKGGKATTVTGLAGVGDLVLTCSSNMSRNYTVGKCLGQGQPIDTGMAVAEGVKTSLALHQLCDHLGVDMPICTAVYRVIYDGLKIEKVLKMLQDRPLGREDDDVFA